MICCQDFRSKEILRKHKKKSVIHYKKLREIVHEYKDDEKTLAIYDIERFKIEGRKTALYVEEFLVIGDENEICGITFHDLICYCDHCMNKQYHLCDDQDIK
jgi:hypothetical protein